MYNDVGYSQYWGAWNNYNSAIQYLSKEPKYRLRAKDIATKEGLLGGTKKKDKRPKVHISQLVCKMFTWIHVGYPKEYYYQWTTVTPPPLFQV